MFSPPVDKAALAILVKRIRLMRRTDDTGRAAWLDGFRGDASAVLICKRRLCKAVAPKPAGRRRTGCLLRLGKPSLSGSSARLDPRLGDDVAVERDLAPDPVSQHLRPATNRLETGLAHLCDHLGLGH